MGLSPAEDSMGEVEERLSTTRTLATAKMIFMAASELVGTSVETFSDESRFSFLLLLSKTGLPLEI